MLEAIRERDRKLHYCATCGNRVHDLDDEDNPHNYTVEQCDAYLAEQAAKRGEVRQPDQKTGHLCWSPEDHHPFVEGEIPDYEEAERDRRTLLRRIDGALSLLRMIDGQPE